jgi:hypothetical protein
VLREQHATKLGEPVRRIVEHAQDRLPIGDGEGSKILLRPQRGKERIGGVLEAGIEEETCQVGVAHGNTGEPHDTRATRRRERTNGASSGAEDLDCERLFAETRRDDRETSGRRCSVDDATSVETSNWGYEPVKARRLMAGANGHCHLVNERLVGVYLRDHHAASAGGLALAERALGPFHPLAKQIAQDRDALENIMRQLGVQPSALRVGAVRMAEYLGRL